MLGQLNLKAKIKNQIDDNTFPRFSILVGQSGSGKKKMCGYIASYLHVTIYQCNRGVEDVRRMIETAYSVNTPILYVIADADRMSLAAQNALLKVTEEPPRNAYFIMTLTDVNNTLGTIRSRGATYYMDNYTANEILEYSLQYTQYTLYDDAKRIIQDICETPGEVHSILPNKASSDAVEFYSYVEKVVDNIALVSGSNSFKIATKISFKDTDKDKYDLKLFWKAFMTICANRLPTDPFKYSTAIATTSKYMQDLRITGINKQSTFDMWLLDIRQDWRN